MRVAISGSAVASLGDAPFTVQPTPLRREGNLSFVGPVSIAILLDHIRVTINAHGDLRFVYDR